MTKEEKNRKIAEWLGWKWDESQGYWHHPDCGGPPQGHRDCGHSEMDFYRNEAASALILEKLPAARLVFYPDTKTWEVFVDWLDMDAPILEENDRKAAIAEAALKLIEP